MNKKVLGIIVVNYPYGTGEPFLHDEIAIMSQYFEHIYIFIPEFNSIDTKKQVYELPPNVFIIGINNKYTFKNKIISIFCNGPLKLLRLVKIALKENRISFSLGVLKNIFSYETKEYDFRQRLLCKINDLNINKSNFILYTYWFTEYTYSIAKIKREYPEITVCTRAHGWDLYFERHTPAFLPHRNLIISILDGTFTISQHGLDYLVKKTQLKNPLIEVSYLGVSAQRQNLYQFDGKELKILSLAFVSPVKNIELLIESLSMIDFPISWVHIGDDDSDYSKVIIDLARKQLRGNKNVRFEFLGNMTYSQIHTFLDSTETDLLINTSFSEGLPVSIMEAFAHGIPAIAPEINGIPEIIDNRINGYILKPSPTPEEILEKFRIFIDLSISEKLELKKNAFKKWQSAFNSTANYKKFAERILAIKQSQEIDTIKNSPL